MSADNFDSLYHDYLELCAPLTEEPSGLTAIGRIYPKVLLLASASYLEAVTTDVIAGLFEQDGLPELRIFVERKSLKRQFHTLFDWDTPKANKFFALFGDECKQRFIKRKNDDSSFSKSVDAFLEIGMLRNHLVHNNYAQFRLEKTAEDIKGLHDAACRFPMEIQSLVTEG